MEHSLPSDRLTRLDAGGGHISFTPWVVFPLLPRGYNATMIQDVLAVAMTVFLITAALGIIRAIWFSLEKH